MAPFVTLKVNGTERKIDVDPDGFTAGELNGVERATGMTWLEWFQQLGNTKISSLAWTALAWVAERRAGSFAPFDEFEDTVKIMELIGSAAPEEVAPAAATVRRNRKNS